MAQKEPIYNMEQIFEELKSSRGLPDNLSTEAQLWDEILKKETFLMPKQLFPLIKEIYGKNYPANTPIKPLATEYSVERSDTKEISSVRADITVLVNNRDIYHFECESKKDKTMVIRMFEYDVHIALSYADSALSLQFPHSAVLYLQNNSNIPDSLTCHISFPKNSFYNYHVPAVKVQSYSLDEILEKHLSILIPFLPLRFRKYLPSKKKNFPKEKLTSFYQQLILILNKETEGGYLSENNRNVILNLLNKAMIRVFYQHDELLKEVIAMTEPILKLEIEKYIYALDAKMNELAFLSNEISQKNDELAQKRNEILQKDNEISQKDSELLQKNNEISQKDSELLQKDNEISQKDSELLEKNNEIALLKKELARLQNK